MVIYVAGDHRGFALKNQIKDFLHEQGYEVYDAGNAQLVDGDDYPDFAYAAASKVSSAPDMTRAILVCGSGVGMNIVANKLKNVRASVCISGDHVIAARKHDAMNVLCIASDYTDPSVVLGMVQAFLATQFDHGDAHTRRIRKIFSLEENGTLS